MAPNASPPEVARARALTGWRAVLALALAVAVPATVAAAAWWVSDEHQLVPGMRGCSLVRDRAAQVGCFSQEFDSLVTQRGLERAFAAVDREAQRSVTVGADCHLAWHPVGEEAGRGDARAGRAYDNVEARTTCQQGYAHGYSIGYMETADPSLGDLVQIVRDECGASDGLDALFNCVHAYGHVIARRSDADAADAIRACEAVDYESLPGTDTPSPVPGERPPVLVGVEHQCLYGLYMEIGMLDVARGDAQLDNCDSATTAAARKACYAYLPARVNAITGDLRYAGQACTELAPAGVLRDSCVKTFSMGLPDAKRCALLAGPDERLQCRRVVHNRDNQRSMLAFASGDPDSFDASVEIAPEPGVAAPAAPPMTLPKAPPVSSAQ